MALLKIENADHLSSDPFVFDVMDIKDKDITATHVLKFGDFVLVESLENLHAVPPFAYAARVADQAKRDTEKDRMAQLDNLLAQKRAEEKLAAEHASEEQRSVRAARAFADAATRGDRPKTKAKTSAVAKHK